MIDQFKNFYSLIQKQIDRMPAPTRWLFGNVVGCILGVGLGIIVMSGVSSVLSHVLAIRFCSGIPCDDNVVIVIAVSGVVGGILGGAFGYVFIQLLLRRSINKYQLLKYTLLGALLWPIVGVFSVIVSLVIFVVFALFSLPLSGLLGTDSSFFYVYTNIIVLISPFIFIVLAFVLIPGALLGFVLALLRQERSAYMVDPTTSEEAG